MIWSEKWQLKISVPKCQTLYLGRGNTGISLNVSNVELLNVCVVKDLGITIDSRFDYSDHIHTIVSFWLLRLTREPVLFYVVSIQKNPVCYFVLLVPMLLCSIRLFVRTVDYCNSLFRCRRETVKVEKSRGDVAVEIAV